MFRYGSSDSTLSDGGCSLVRVSVSECHIRCSVFKVQTLQVSSQSGAVIICYVINGRMYVCSDTREFVVDILNYSYTYIYIQFRE